MQKGQLRIHTEEEILDKEFKTLSGNILRMISAHTRKSPHKLEPIDISSPTSSIRLE